MKVGDTYFLDQYKEQIFHDDDSDEFVAEAWIEKKRGIHKFYGTWTFPTKPLRSLIMTSGDFKITKGGIIKFKKGMISGDIGSTNSPIADICCATNTVR